MIKIGLLGAGHLGKIHLKCLQTVPSTMVSGFYDPNAKAVQSVQEKYPDLIAFPDANSLIAASDAVIIATPTITHFQLARQIIQQKKHFLVEKPLTHTAGEANRLVEMVAAAGVVAQVGYVERFNPAWQAVRHLELQPMFIEAHRLASFNPRGTDVSVVHDLMVHDLDMVLHLIQSPLESIHASGVAVISNSPDIANVRLEFSNGGVANLTASRISVKQMRKLRLFQKDTYVSLDFLEKQAQIVRLHNETPPRAKNLSLLPLETANGNKLLEISQSTPNQGENAIRSEQLAFVKAILSGSKTAVSVAEGAKTLAVACQIIDKIEERLQKAGN